jgi:signal transduction histidine kinase
MRISLKLKLTTLISLLVLVVVLCTSALYAARAVREALQDVLQKGAYIRDETYTRVRAVVSKSHLPPCNDPGNFEALRQYIQQRLSQDDGLRSLMQSAVGYSMPIDYVALTNPTRVVLAHNDAALLGQTLPYAPPLEVLLRENPYSQLRTILGRPEVYEEKLSLDLQGQPFCDVRVGLSTVFLRAQLMPQLRSSMELAAAIVVLATLTAALLSFTLMGPLQSIEQSVDRLSRGEYTEPVRLERGDEWGILSSKLSLLGEHMRGEKAAFVALKENLDQLFSNLTDGLLLFDHQDRLVLATPATSRFLHQDVDAMSRRTAQEFFGQENPLHLLLRQAFETRLPLREITLDMPDDSELPRVRVNAHFIEEGSHHVATLVSLSDAGTRAQLEDQLDLTAKLAALGKLTSGVAHEVKNPLNAMVLQVEILRSKLAGRDEDIKPQLNILSTEIRRLDRVVKTFLDFTRPLVLKPTETNVEDLVREVFTLAEPYARQSNVSLVLQPNGVLPRLRVDRDLMKQALLNLILNGCQAMPTGGTLTVAPHADARWVELQIADQGGGIAPEAREKIFSLYYTTKPGGTGVGLAMTYRIIQLHQGTIDFTSALNEGTTFRVSLPRA